MFRFDHHLAMKYLRIGKGLGHVIDGTHFHIQFPELTAPVIPGLGAEGFFQESEYFLLFFTGRPLTLDKILTSNRLAQSLPRLRPEDTQSQVFPSEVS